MSIDFSIFIEYLPFLLVGFWLTIKIVAGALFLGLPFGLVLALGRKSNFFIPRFAATSFIEIFRNTPFIIQVFLFYYVLPFYGIRFPAEYVGTVALAAILFTTRFILAVHHEIVELLHLIGAHDNYIADQFQKHAFSVALKGGIGGTAFAIATLLIIVFLTRDLDASLLPPAGLKWWHWLVLAALPVAEAYGAMFTARITIMRVLKLSF